MSLFSRFVGILSAITLFTSNLVCAGYLEDFQKGFLEARQIAREQNGLDLKYEASGALFFGIPTGEWEPPAFGLTELVNVSASPLDGSGPAKELGKMGALEGGIGSHQYSADEIRERVLELIRLDHRSAQQREEQAEATRRAGALLRLWSRAVSDFVEVGAQGRSIQDPYVDATLLAFQYLRDSVYSGLSGLKLEDDVSQVIFGVNSTVGKKILLSFGSPVQTLQMGALAPQAVGTYSADLASVKAIAVEICTAVLTLVKRDPTLIPGTSKIDAELYNSTLQERWHQLEKRVKQQDPGALVWSSDEIAKHQVQTSPTPYASSVVFTKGQQVVAVLSIGEPNPPFSNFVNRRVVVEPALTLLEKAALVELMLPTLINKPLLATRIEEPREVSLVNADPEFETLLQDVLPGNFSIKPRSCESALK